MSELDLNNTDLKGANVIMGVSLSNKTFNRRFASRLADWTAGSGAASLWIFLADELEVINYVVFNDKPDARAGDIAKVRALSLGRMFESFGNALRKTNTSFTWKLESEWRRDSQLSGKIAYYDRTLRTLAQSDVPFQEDLKKQVHLNLHSRAERFGTEFIDLHMEHLQKYIIGELSVFFAFWATYPKVIEVYPGRNLFIKERVCDGFYDGARARLGIMNYHYLDVSFLTHEDV